MSVLVAMDPTNLDRSPSPHRTDQTILDSIPALFADLLLGHLYNRPPVPPLRMDRQAVRLLPLHPPCSRVKQITPWMGSQRPNIDLRLHIVHQRRYTSGYCAALVIS